MRSREPMGIRILIVDDNEVFRRPLQRALEAAGFEVVAVPSAEAALDALAARTTDLLLTDQRLPGMDGVQLITRVKATHPAVAIVAMTAYGTIESAVEARRCGADDYLLKPFEVPDLLRTLHRVLDQQKAPARGRAE
jgi:DNA-binding NtrC family response regulator